MGPYRTRASEEKNLSSLHSWPVLDAEIVTFLVCSVILVIGVCRRSYGTGETLAMLGALASARVLVAAVADAVNARRRMKGAQRDREPLS